MKKRYVDTLLGFIIFCIVSMLIFTHKAYAADVDATDYTYTITPILAPFNEYFFVKTNNPDPTSFRFSDKSSKYSDEACIAAEWDEWDDIITLYADIKYQNTETGRISGGYIFRSYDTDGGELVLQTRDDSYYTWDVTWSDTTIKYTLPALVDDVDYLINTYGTESNFFDNMDAIESGFQSICLYRGANIRGELYRAEDSFWCLSSSPHKDQSLYIQSPYGRKENKKMFASVIYPYRYDSLGFPSVMGAVSKRLDSTAVWEWNEDYHCYINVTYGDETRIYGGAGDGGGQGITQDKIKKYFTFDTNAAKITLVNSRELLDYYGSLEIGDDVPRDDMLTWESVCDTVGNGTWVRLIDLLSVYGSTDVGYAYLYEKGEGKEFITDPAGNTGAELYWGGDLGYASDAWVDGRYVNSWEVLVPGATFEDYPTSNILLKNVTVPQITYDYVYNYDTYEYEYNEFSITEKKKTVCFCYSEEGIWTANYHAFDDGCADYYEIAQFVEEGYIDEKYLDMVTLTMDEINELEVDRNTNSIPKDYLVFDGLAEPGTSLVGHKHNYMNKVTEKSTYSAEGEETCTCRICLDTYTRAIPKMVSEFTYDSYTTTSVKLKWTKNTSAQGYIIEQLKDDNWTVIKTIEGNATTNYTVTGLSEGTLYEFRISGYVLYDGKKTYGTPDYIMVMTQERIDLSNAKLSISQPSFGYTGNYIKPIVTVKVNVDGAMKTLTNWKDYKVEYKNFKNPGTARITVVGRGDYKGQKSITFTIRPVDLSKATVTISQPSFGYTGEYIKPVVTVKAKINGKTVTLTNWKDYKVTYKNFKNPGVATITVSGRGITSGTKSLTFQIRPAQVKNIKYVGKSTSYVNFKWDKCVGVTGYEVYRATSKTGTYSKVGTVATTSYKNTGLKKGTTYYYKVRAYKTVGSTKIYGNYSAVYTIATK